MNRFDPRPSSPTQLAVTGGVIAALAWFGLLGPAGLPALYAGGLLLLIAVAGWVIKPRRPTQYWRGQAIDMSESLTWGERLYYRVFRNG